MTSPRSSRRPGQTAEGAAVDPLAFAPFTRARHVRAELVAGILRSGRTVPDEAFDEIYPEPVKRASPAHWTPVRVCARIVELLRLGRGDRLLDVGAGAGKFCIIAAAMSQARVRGIERQPELAGVAREAARRLRIDIEIESGTFESEDVASVETMYFFNPFAETILLPGVRDVAADRFAGRAARDIAAAEEFLQKARVGTRLVTFCGFGGAVPMDYERLAQEAWDGGVLEVWVKRTVETSRRPSDRLPTRTFAAREAAQATATTAADESERVARRSGFPED